ncbi:hypothetical protein NDU88_001932 [Pleurodeles waltl]|uniref:Uncharacterized protein n=1 Tax=Pleurodeles waltl TaxID=8319 RepID=A0AAV7UU38_PLEWA|nr:hypothetical protein NDU88_001932 [Pleurodeles waltl]
MSRRECQYASQRTRIRLPTIRRRDTLILLLPQESLQSTEKRLVLKSHLVLRIPENKSDPSFIDLAQQLSRVLWGRGRGQ